MAGQAGALGIGVKDALVVGLAVEVEVLFHLGIQVVAVLLQGGGGHAHAAVQVDDALEGGVGLKAHDDLVVLVDVAGGKVVDAGDHVGLHVDDALFDLLQNEGLGLLPHLGGLGGDGGQEGVVPLVGGVVLLDKVAHVHQVAPLAGAEALPGGAVDVDAHCYHSFLTERCGRFRSAAGSIPLACFCPWGAHPPGDRGCPGFGTCEPPGCGRGEAPPFPPGGGWRCIG